MMINMPPKKSQDIPIQQVLCSEKAASALSPRAIEHRSEGRESFRKPWGFHGDSTPIFHGDLKDL